MPQIQLNNSSTESSNNLLIAPCNVIQLKNFCSIFLSFVRLQSAYHHNEYIFYCTQGQLYAKITAENECMLFVDQVYCVTGLKSFMNESRVKGEVE